MNERALGRSTNTRSATAPMLRGLAMIAGLVVASGCSAGQPAPELPTAARPRAQAPVAAEPGSAHPRTALSPAAREVRFHLEPPAGGADFRAAEGDLRRLLGEAGYRLVEGGDERDATLRLQVEGIATDGSAETERASVQLVQEGAVVQWLVSGATSPERRAFELADLVDRLSASPSVASLAAASTTRREARRQALAGERAPRAEASGGEESAFNPALARRCLNQRSRAACAKLADYVAANPGSGDAQRAKAILERSRYAP